MTELPDAIQRSLRKAEPAELVMGCSVPVAFRLVSLKINLTVPPSSQPCWSAYEKRISLEPLGLKLEAVWGAKETFCLEVM